MVVWFQQDGASPHLAIATMKVVTRCSPATLYHVLEKCFGLLGYFSLQYVTYSFGDSLSFLFMGQNLEFWMNLNMQ